MKKNTRPGKAIPYWDWGEGVHFPSGNQKLLLWGWDLELRPEWQDQGRYGKIWGKGILGRRKGWCKGFESGVTLVCSRHNDQCAAMVWGSGELLRLKALEGPGEQAFWVEGKLLELRNSPGLLCYTYLWTPQTGYLHPISHSHPLLKSLGPTL